MEGGADAAAGDISDTYHGADAPVIKRRRTFKPRRKRKRSATAEEHTAGEPADTAEEHTAGEPFKRKKKKRRRSVDTVTASEYAVPPAHVASDVIVAEETLFTFCPAEDRMAPLCCRCGLPLKPGANLQLSGKGNRSFKCGTCNTRSVQISRSDVYRDFQQNFKGVDKDEAMECWKSLGK